MNLQYLQWDSDFFGYSIARLDVKQPACVDEVRDKIRSSEYDVVYVFLDCPTSDDIDRFKDFGDPQDVRVTFETELPTKQPLEMRQRPVPYRGGITETLNRLAVASGWQSRFYNDIRFRPHYERLYREWIRNSVDQGYADAVFVINENCKQVGFVTTAKKKDIGQIGIIAVDSIYRRRGIGQALIETSLAWGKSVDARFMRVATQETNHAACRLYDQTGFHFRERIAIFHYWNDSR